MSKKIKSVKTKTEYKEGFAVKIPIGIEGIEEIKQNGNVHYSFLNVDFSESLFAEDFLITHPEWFAIEYESERKSIAVRIEYENEETDNSNLTTHLIWKALREYYLKNSYIVVTEINIGEDVNG